MGAARGFSLVELVLVASITALLAGVAVPQFGQAVARQRVAAAARRIVVDLKLAQRQAKTSSSSQTVSFDVAADSYRLVGMADMDRPGDEYAVMLLEAPYRATIASADFAGDAAIVFDGWGLPDSGGSVVIQVGSYSKTISVDATTGEASIP